MSIVLLPMKCVIEPPSGMFALLDGADETVDVAGAALVGVLAAVDAVGEAAVVADVSPPVTPPWESAAGAAAETFPAWDGSPQVEN